MLTRKPSILLATFGSLHSLTANLSGSSTSFKQKRRGTRQQGCRNEYRRYATIADDHNRHDDHGNGQHEWPSPPKGQTSPTPYQIFAMKDNASYSKARFYELVKIYHPDLNNNNNGQNRMPHALKVERYRLIVAAHTILSDPTKRSAYDRFGAGWNGKAEVGGRDTWYQGSPHARPGPFSQSWSNPNDPIWQNATWEDWERFYARKKGGDGAYEANRSGVYLQNSYFLILVIVLALMGSTANYTRAQDAGTYFVEQRDIAHDRAARELRKARKEATTSSSKDERIQWFVRNREATLDFPGSDAEVLKEERADRLLPDRDVCRSEKIVEKDVTE